MPDTIVVGLDGASSELLGDLIREGRVPALERILEEGVSGDLESVLPPVTSPNWKAYATGKNPGKLGIFWWHNVDVANRRVHRPAERYGEHTEYWELLASDERVGVLGVPTTYPPRDTCECYVSGPPDAPETGYTYPPSLEQELKTRFDYRQDQTEMLSDGTEAACREVLEMIDSRFEAAKYLLEEYDLSFLQVTTFYINALHHNLWDDECTKRGWEVIDGHLADLLERDCDLVLMSDHGHAEIETVFNVNAWLEREGYLAYDDRAAETLFTLGVNTTRIKRALSAVDRRVPSLSVRAAVERAVPQWLVNRLPNEAGELGGSKHEMADWDRTEAIASAQGPIYLTLERGTPQYETLREELIAKLSALTDPDGRPVATAVYRAEEVYSGPYLDEAPGVVVDKAPHVNMREGFGADRVFPDSDPNWRGVNRREGLFAAVGPSFRSGSVEGLSILDLAPTLLSLHGQQVPPDMDGEVRADVFAEGTTTASREGVHAESD